MNNSSGFNEDEEILFKEFFKEKSDVEETLNQHLNQQEQSKEFYNEDMKKNIKNTAQEITKTYTYPNMGVGSFKKKDVQNLNDPIPAPENDEDDEMDEGSVPSISKLEKRLKKATKERESVVHHCGKCNSVINTSNSKFSNVYKSGRKDKNVFLSCKNCMNDFPRCECCREYFSSHNLLVEGHCQTCIEAAGKAGVSYLKQYHFTSSRGMKIKIAERPANHKYLSDSANQVFGNFDYRSFWVNPHGIVQKTFGIELEFQVKNSLGLGVIIAHKALEKTGLPAGIERDGTLKNVAGEDNGFEIVSAPMDKLSHFQFWGDFLDILARDSNIYCAPYAPPLPGQDRGTGCGCHIHANKELLTHPESYGKNTIGYGLAALKYRTFIHFPSNRKFIELISGRESNMFSDYTSPRGLIFKNNRIVKGSHDVMSVDEGIKGHRTAVNLNTSTHKTFETRIFKSTTNKEELFRFLDWVDALCEFCRMGVASIQHMKDWIYFYNFVKEYPEEYPYLMKFFETDVNFLRLLEQKMREHRGQ